MSPRRGRHDEPGKDVASSGAQLFTSDIPGIAYPSGVALTPGLTRTGPSGPSRKIAKKGHHLVNFSQWRMPKKLSWNWGDKIKMIFDGNSPFVSAQIRPLSPFTCHLRSLYPFTKKGSWHCRQSLTPSLEWIQFF